MKILTKGQASRAVINSIFTPGGTLACKKKIRWDMGKYQETIIGRDLPETETGIVWAERRTDKDGPYYALYCLD
jgi:hypothetical protein